jgi:hypothetical protein
MGCILYLHVSLSREDSNYRWCRGPIPSQSSFSFLELRQAILFIASNLSTTMEPIYDAIVMNSEKGDIISDTESLEDDGMWMPHPTEPFEIIPRPHARPRPGPQPFDFKKWVNEVNRRTSARIRNRRATQNIKKAPLTLPSPSPSL